MMLAGDDRLASYFVVVGLGDNPTPYEEVSDDAVKQKSKLKPITDIAVINCDEGEEPPQDYVMIEHTPSKQDADLNHGSFRAPRMHLCYKRGTHKPPLTEIGVIFEGKEQPMEGCSVVEFTPYGRSANVNNSTKERTFLVFRRAATLSASELYAVTEIEVLNKSRGDRAPHCFLEISKPLNRAMIGSEMILCYRKAPVRWNTIAYRPSIISRYPLSDYADIPLPPSVPLFCLPLGCTIEAWPRNYSAPASPAFSTFVLTRDVQRQLYGASIDFYEPFDSRLLNDEQRLHLGLDMRVADLAAHSPTAQQVQTTHVTTKEDCTTPTPTPTPTAPLPPGVAENEGESVRLMRTVCRKSIGVLSPYPCFDAFRDFLRFLHKLVTTGSRARHALRIERYVTFFINSVLLPSASKNRILLQLSPADCVRIELPFERPIEAGGASFRRFLMHLGAENCVELFALVLVEQKLLIHSLVRSEVTPVCEAIRAMTFPCAWQCVYVPLCPPGIAHEITAGSSFDDFLGMPHPFIVGVDSRSFDYFTPPDDVICIDIDTRAILRTGEKRSLTASKLLPKRALKQLRSTLDDIFQQMLADDERERVRATARRAASLDPLALDEEIARRKRREFGVDLLIQQAFVRCMCTLLRGYKQFFKPIVRAPTLDTARDLFDTEAFIRSRDKHDARFYQLLTHTQMFTRFVEECSFTTNPALRSALAFFDECATRSDLLDNAAFSSAAGAFNAAATKLLHTSSSASLNNTPTLSSSSTSLTHASKSGTGDLPRRDSVAVSLDGTPFSLFALDLRADPSETTVFLSVPEPDANAALVVYNGFPLLDAAELCVAERTPRAASASSDARPNTASSDDPMQADARLLVIRDKQELRHSQRHAEDAFRPASLPEDSSADAEGDDAENRDEQQRAKARIKCVLYHCYAIWFMQLPAYSSLVHDVAGRRRLLRLAYEMVLAFHERNRFVVADQVCHRVLMLLCGRYQEPRLAVRTLDRMRRHVDPNAITYACYNRTLYECRWDVESHAGASWRRIRHLLLALACFRAPIKRARRQTVPPPASDAPPATSRLFDHRRSASIASALPPVAVTRVEEETASTASLSVGSLEVLPHRIAISSSDSLPTQSSAEKQSTGNFSLHLPDANANRLLSVNAHGDADINVQAENEVELEVEVDIEGECRSAPGEHEPSTPKAGLDETPRPETFQGNPFEQHTTQTPAKNDETPTGVSVGGTAQHRSEAKRTRMSLQLGGASVRRTDRLYSPAAAKIARSPGHASKQQRILQMVHVSPSNTKTRHFSIPSSSHGMLLDRTSAAGILMTSYTEQDTPGAQKSDKKMERRSESTTWRKDAQPIANSVASKDSGLQHVGPSDTELRMLLETSSGVAICHEPVAPDEPSSESKSARRAARSNMLQERSDLHISYLEKQRPPRPPPPNLNYRSSTTATDSPAGSEAGVTPVADVDPVQHVAAVRSGSVKSSESALSGTPDAVDSNTEAANLSKWATSLKHRLNTNTLSYKSKLTNSTLLNAVRQAFQSSNSPLHTLKSSAVAYLHYAASTGGDAATYVGSTPTHSDASRTRDARGSLENYAEDRNRQPAATAAQKEERLSDDELEPVAVRSYYTGDSGYVDDASIQHFLPTSGASPSHERGAGRSDCTDSARTHTHTDTTGQRRSGKRDTKCPVLVEVDLCSVSRCETCQLLLYDEEIMSGWLPDDSNLRTSCQFCETPTVPRLQVVIRDRRPVVVEQLRSALHSQEKEPAEIEPSDKATEAESERPRMRKTTARVHQLEPISVPFLSSLVLRKELETVIASESETALARPSFADKHPILFWNLVYIFKRLMLPTHLPGFVLYLRVVTGASSNSQLFTASGSSTGSQRSGAAELDRDAVEPRLLYSAAQYVRVRLLWDNPHSLSVDDAYRPFYYALKRRRSMALAPTVTPGVGVGVGDPVFDRAEAIASTIRNALMQKREDVRACIELLIRERERVQNEVQMAVVTATQQDQGSDVAPVQHSGDQLSAAATGISYTLTKRSIYREILFLLIADLGSQRIDFDAYDTKYTSAFNQLSAADKNRLLPNDAPPLTINRLFRRAFSPQPLELF